MKLWKDEASERLVCYPAAKKKSKTAAVIFPGGAYAFLAEHEGKGYAEWFNSVGCDAFVCLYRVAPDAFPLPLLDARRAVRLVRAHAKELEIDPGKIVVIGSSAGGNLAALLSTYQEPLPGEGVDETDAQPFLPNGQILCYPVVSLADDNVTHRESRQNLLGGRTDLYEKLSPELHVTKDTPRAFLWHTAGDGGVNPENTLRYASALQRAGVPYEAHIFPGGLHGMGLAQDDPVIGQWTKLLETWLSNL